MARITGSNIFSLSGKLGGMVYCRWKDTQYVRTLSNKPPKAPTEAQMATRAKMKLATRLLSPLRSVIETSWTPSPRNMTGYNAAVSHFIRYCIAGTYPDLVPDYRRIVFSKGTLPQAMGASLHQCGGGIKVMWHMRSWLENPLDRATIVIFDATNEEHLVLENCALRSDEEVVLHLPEGYAGDTLHCYLFFRSDDKRFASSTQYLGELNYKLVLTGFAVFLLSSQS